MAVHTKTLMFMSLHILMNYAGSSTRALTSAQVLLLLISHES